MADPWSRREFELMCGSVEEHHTAMNQLPDRKVYDSKGVEYSWTQTPEDIEISFHRHALTTSEARSLARVDIRMKHLRVAMKEEIVFDDELWEAVRPDESF